MIYAMQEENTRQLFASLRTMFERAKQFGGGLFALAASVMTDLIHHDPLCFKSLDEAGLPEAFINAVQVCERLSICPCNYKHCGQNGLMLACHLAHRGEVLHVQPHQHRQQEACTGKLRGWTTCKPASVLLELWGSLPFILQ